MSTLIRVDGRDADVYQAVADEDAPPPDGAVLVSFDRWQCEHESLLSRGQPVGVRIANTVDVAAAGGGLKPASLILLEFPAFADGRAYSQARLLREAHGYRGELRATGAAVVRDQLLGMVRCGIESFELRADQSTAECLKALREFSVAYQPALDALPRVRELRRGRIAS
jgi:uncharacterized protein (DUF934 family)